MTVVIDEPSGHTTRFIPLRQLSGDELQGIVSEHRLWVETAKRKGARAELNQMDLSWRSFQNTELSEANLEGANLEGANLQGAKLRGANLRGANLRKAMLKEAHLWDADLEGADLREAIDLLPAQLGGANLCYAELPKAFDALEKQTNLFEACQTADRLVISMLLGCAFASLTIAGTTDANLLGDITTTKLPLIGTDVHIMQFFAVTPLLLFGFFIYVNLYLRLVWDGMAALPAIFPDGTPIHEKTYPWLMSGLPRAYWPQLRAERSFLSWLQARVTHFGAWWAVPITLWFFWWSYLSRLQWLPKPWPAGSYQHWLPQRWPLAQYHRCWFPWSSDGLMTLLHLGLLLVAIWAGQSFYSLTKATFCRNEKELARWKRFTFKDWIPRWRIARASITVLLLVLLTPWLMEQRGADLGGGALDGVELPGARLPKADLEGVKMRGADLEKVRLEAAHLEGAQLSGSHLSQIHLEGAHLERAGLENTDLTGANLRGAFLGNAELQGAHLWNADLREADLREANLQKHAVLQSAYLEDAQMQGAHLENATLQGAYLTQAHLQGAHLESANLQGAYLDSAQLQGAHLGNAALQGAFLENAQLQRAHLGGAQLVGANLQNADFRKADLRGADLSGADLRGVSFREAQLQVGPVLQDDSQAAVMVGANLEDADLRGAELRRGTNLKGTRYNTGTRWPSGFDPKAYGAVQVP